MNKITRASIAGVAGIGLLAGGATFALWSSDAEIPGATINSGTLSLSQQPGAVWTDVTNATATEEIGTDLSTYTVVPGSRLQYTAKYEIEATGDNLAATLAYTDVIPAGTSSGELHDALTVDSAFTGVEAGRVTSANGGQTVDVTVTVTVDPTLTTGQDSTAALKAGTVTLTQTTPQVDAG